MVFCQFFPSRLLLYSSCDYTFAVCLWSPDRAAAVGKFYRTGKPPLRLIDFVTVERSEVIYSNMFVLGFDRLSHYLDDGRCMQPDTCLAIVTQLLDGLGELAAGGFFTHGSISVENILVKSNDRGGSMDLRIGVFGDACRREDDVLGLARVVLKLWTHSQYKFLLPLLHGTQKIFAFII